MKIKSVWTGVVLGLAFVAPAALAESAQPEFEAIRAQQAEIRQGVESRTGRYKDMPANDRSQLLASQARALGILEGKQGVGDLTEDQRLQAFNALEHIEALVNKAEDERMVCEQRTTLGSNRKTRFCMTVQARREARERARDELSTQQTQNLR